MQRDAVIEPQIDQGGSRRGKVLAFDPAAKVPCPGCGKPFMEVTDVTWPDGSHLEQYIKCLAYRYNGGDGDGGNNVLTK